MIDSTTAVPIYYDERVQSLIYYICTSGALSHPLTILKEFPTIET